MTNKKPKRLSFGDAIARPIRGPKRDEPRSWYWQVQREKEGGRETLFSGWGTRDEIKARTLDYLAHEPSPEEARRLEVASIESVRDVLETFVGAQRARHEANDLTVYGYRNSRNDGRHLARLLGSTRVVGLRRAELENYRNTRRTEGAAPSSVKREIKTMRAAWRWALDNELIPDRELPRVKTSDEPVRAKYNPTPEECRLVIEQMHGWPRFVASMLAVTGTRIGAIAQLKFGGIEGGAAVLITKGKMQRFPMTEQLKEALELGNYETEYLHGTTPTMVTGHFSSREMPRACKKAGVPRFSAHGFRRAAVDALQRAGVDIKTAADLLGHSPEVMLKYYREASREDLTAAAEKLGQLMAPEGSRDDDEARKAPAVIQTAVTTTSEPPPPPSDSPEAPKGESVTESATGEPAGSPKNESPQGLTSPAGFRFGTPKGNRTPVSGVRGQRPNR